jgi:hypothetical protein
MVTKLPPKKRRTRTTKVIPKPKTRIDIPNIEYIAYRIAKYNEKMPHQHPNPADQPSTSRARSSTPTTNNRHEASNSFRFNFGPKTHITEFEGQESTRYHQDSHTFVELHRKYSISAPHKILGTFGEHYEHRTEGKIPCPFSEANLQTLAQFYLLLTYQEADKMRRNLIREINANYHQNRTERYEDFRSDFNALITSMYNTNRDGEAITGPMPPYDEKTQTIPLNKVKESYIRKNGPWPEDTENSDDATENGATEQEQPLEEQAAPLVIPEEQNGLLETPTSQASIIRTIKRHKKNKNKSKKRNLGTTKERTKGANRWIVTSEKPRPEQVNNGTEPSTSANTDQIPPRKARNTKQRKAIENDTRRHNDHLPSSSPEVQIIESRPQVKAEQQMTSQNVTPIVTNGAIKRRSKIPTSDPRTVERAYKQEQERHSTTEEGSNSEEEEDEGNYMFTQENPTEEENRRRHGSHDGQIFTQGQHRDQKPASEAVLKAFIAEHRPKNIRAQHIPTPKIEELQNSTSESDSDSSTDASSDSSD